MKFSGVMLGSQNPTQLGEFYSKVLGDAAFRDGDWWGWKNFAQFMIGPHSEVHGMNDVPQRIMLTLEVDDVKAAFAEITSHGATVVADPYLPDNGEGMWLATVADPDGNYVQLMTPWE